MQRKGYCRLIALPLFLLFFLTACQLNKKNSDGNIYLSELKGYLNTSKETPRFQDLNVQNCKSPVDSLRQNLPYGYKEAIANLSNKLLNVDKQGISTQSKQFAKAIICADFVYAAFSYHHPGDTLGFEGDTLLSPGWDSLPLEVCYDLGNKNVMGVYCDQRSGFYLRLVKKLIGIDGKIIAKDKIHSFPVIFIVDDNGKKKPYLIDPYDPFIQVAQGGNIIPAFNEYGIDPYDIEIYRTRRAYGKTRVLVSKKIIDNLRSTGSQSPFCLLPGYLRNYITGYLKQNTDRDSTIVNLPNYRDSYILSNNRKFEYAIEMDGRPDGQLFDLTGYKRYYSK